jgi:hypothetical protein
MKQSAKTMKWLAEQSAALEIPVQKWKAPMPDNHIQGRIKARAQQAAKRLCSAHNSKYQWPFNPVGVLL